jgi:dTDP-glucose 4,6-dehydratase
MLIPDQDLRFILGRIETFREELREIRIFLTGGTGFVGRWLLGALSGANRAFDLRLDLTLLTRGGDYFHDIEGDLEDTGFHIIRGDVRDFSFPDGEFSLVVHAAAESSRPTTDRETHQTIVEGTRRCLEFARRHGTRRFLYVSSGAVYGRQPADLERVSETADSKRGPEGLNAYGRAKLEAERMVIEAAGPDATIARGFAFVGPHLALDRHFAIGNFIRDALGGGPIVVRGDGTPLRSYLYAADLVIWLLTVMLRGRPGWAYNVGSEEAISIGNLARLVADTVRPNTPVEVLEAPTGAPAAQYVPSTERARRDLGLQVWTTLAEAIRRTANWYSSGRAEE